MYQHSSVIQISVSSPPGVATSSISSYPLHRFFSHHPASCPLQSTVASLNFQCGSLALAIQSTASCSLSFLSVCANHLRKTSTFTSKTSKICRPSDVCILDPILSRHYQKQNPKSCGLWGVILQFTTRGQSFFF